MPDKPGTVDDRLDESADMIAEPDAADPADLTGSAAAATADHQHDETDDIAASADPQGPGHGSVPPEADRR